MTIRLSKPMQRTLKSAPDYWSKLSIHTPSVDALQKRGLVEMRNQPGETGVLTGYQWRISETGREVDGRGPEPTFDVDVWNFEGDVIDHARGITADEVDEIRERYSDDPVDVVVEECD